MYNVVYVNSLEAPVPCPNCSRVAFCSLNCQKQALATHHKIECPILQVMWDSGASIICLMALRILSQRGLKYFLDLKDILKQVRNVNYMTLNNRTDVPEQMKRGTRADACFI